jgi:dihydrofolate reductase
MKPTTTTLLSVDGVLQGPGGPQEDRRDGFERGGWAMGRGGDEVPNFIVELYQNADAFLFGRWTFELFASYWGSMEAGSHPIAEALNTRPQVRDIEHPHRPCWTNSTILSGDIAAAIGKLKATPGGELQVHGSGTLVRWLLANELVDEMNLIIVPVVVGEGTRLFPDRGLDLALDLVDSRAFPQGVTIQVYSPAGRPQYAAPGELEA